MRLALAIVLLLIVAPAAHADGDGQFFEAKIRPLLVQHCDKCHGGTNAKGGLSLASRKAWQAGGDSGAVLIPGKPDESRLMERLRSAEADFRMPPNQSLPKADQELFAEWIRRGAIDPRGEETKSTGMTPEMARQWWSFQPLTPVPVPAAVGVTDAKGGSPAAADNMHPIDRFLNHKLAGTAIPVSPAADRRTLIRRVTYDLTGLPPTAAEVDQFLKDPASDHAALSRLVDRLLAQPSYGEKWGRIWLDVVRYADTAGENTDRPLPEIWRYRNWVIESLQKDLPFDQFVRLQIAGDLLTAEETGTAYEDGIVATGYLALARRFGHDCDKENHLMYEDLIDNLGKGFLGLTISCARCHDHKYDPFTREDYYALFGIFDSSRFSFSGCEAKGQPRDLVPLLKSNDVEARLKPWQDRRAVVDQKLKELDAQLASGASRWTEQLKDRQILAAGEVAEGGRVELNGESQPGLKKISVRSGDVLLFVILPRGNHGADTTLLKWTIRELSGAMRHWSTEDLLDRLIENNPLGDPSAAATESGAAIPASTDARWCFLDGQAQPAFLDEFRDRHEQQTALKFWRRGDTPSVFVNQSNQPVKVWTELAPRSFFVHPGPQGPVVVAWISPVDGEVSLAAEVADAHPAPGLDGIAYSIEHLSNGSKEKTAPPGQLLSEWGSAIRDRIRLVRQRDEIGPAPVIPAAFAVIEGQPHHVRVQMQGDPEKPGEEVPRRWLAQFGGQPVSPAGGSGRRQLADWIAQHPLTARVIVNRVWQGHFGQGLVRSVNDFGFRGERPSHPELLDWLSQQFVANGYSLKWLHRQMLLSAAYSRSSQILPQQHLQDPENRLLSHFNASRLTAEELRDSLLAVSGELDLTPGKAHPFPPVESWTFTQHNPFSAVYDNRQRTVYQMVQRQRRHPFLALFDGADPNASTGQRQITTVPTQSLYFLNDPFFHAQAEAVARRVLAAETNSEPREVLLWRTILQREPDADERHWFEHWMRTYPGEPLEKVAACARVLLSSNEFLYLD